MPFTLYSVYTTEIWKCSFITTASPVHTNPLQNRSFLKILLNWWKYLKTLALCLRVDGKHFEKEAFLKRWCHDNHVTSLPGFSHSQTQMQIEHWLLHNIDRALILGINSRYLFCLRTCLSRRRTSQGFLWPWSCMLEQCFPYLLLLWDSRWPSRQTKSGV